MVTQSPCPLQQDGRAEEASQDSAALALGDSAHPSSSSSSAAFSFSVRVCAVYFLGVFLTFRDAFLNFPRRCLKNILPRNDTFLPGLWLQE